MESNLKLNPLTPGAFCQKHIFRKFWRFSAWIWAKLAPIYSKRHLQHDRLLFFQLAFRDLQLYRLLFFFFSPFLFLHLLAFCCSDWPSTGLASSSKISQKASSRRASFTMEYSHWKFCSTFGLGIIGKIFSCCRTWAKIMPILVKGDDVSSGTKTNACHGELQPAQESMG